MTRSYLPFALIVVLLALELCTSASLHAQTVSLTPSEAFTSGSACTPNGALSYNGNSFVVCTSGAWVIEPVTVGAGGTCTTAGQLQWTGSALQVCNGLSWVSPPAAAGGSNTDVQYNSSGSLSGSNNFVFTGTDVGIGTVTPLALLEINGVGNSSINTLLPFYNNGATQTINLDGEFDYITVSTASVQTREVAGLDYMYVSPSANLTQTLFGRVSQVQVAAANTHTIQGMMGEQSIANNWGTGAITTVYGFSANSWNEGAATITTQDDLIVIGGNASASGIITTQYGIYDSYNSNVGTVTSGYGLYITGEGSGGTWTNKPYDVYAADTGVYNYFGGNVGIGTTAPGSLLDIDKAGTGGLGPEIRLDNTSATGGDSAQISYYEGPASNKSYLKFYMPSGGWPQFSYYDVPLAKTMFWIGAGNVGGQIGIGTSTPNGFLDVENTGSTTGVILNAGNVGIGSTSPVNALDVNAGGIHIGNSVPSSTSYALYNNAGSLYWNGSPLINGTSGTIWEMIASTDIATAATSYTFSGLSGDTDQEYQLVLRLINGASTSGSWCYMTLNGDTTTSDYGNQLLEAVGSTSIAQRYNGTEPGVYFAYTSTLGNLSIAKAFIYAKSGYTRQILVEAGLEDAGNVNSYWQGATATWTGSGQVTSVGVNCATTNELGVGTHIELWAKRSVNGLTGNSPTPGGSSSNVQYNSGGLLQGDSGFTYAGSGGTVTIAGGVTLSSNVPSSTTNALYNNGGALYWNGAPVPAAYYAKMYANTAQSATNKIATNTVEYDSTGGSMGDITNNRINIVHSGKYHITAFIYASGLSNYLDGLIYKDGSPIQYCLRANASLHGDAMNECNVTLSLTSGDYIELYDSTNSGTATTSTTTGLASWLAVQYVGP
jgi:hypothetical protein